jgi:hypothetical protein
MREGGMSEPRRRKAWELRQARRTVTARPADFRQAQNGAGEKWMSDFPDDDGADFLGDDPDDLSAQNRCAGLVVPARARVILAKDGSILWDENAEAELAFRKAGRPNIEFYDENWQLESFDERLAARRAS